MTTAMMALCILQPANAALSTACVDLRKLNVDKLVLSSVFKKLPRSRSERSVNGVTRKLAGAER